ncbi:MAG: Ig-like domain-containing protein [Chitinophagaceae bacterium]
MRKIFLLFLLTAALCQLNAQTCGTTNIALNKTTAASSEGEWHKKGDAVDGDATTTWWGPLSSDNEYIYVDLGQSYTICKVNIIWSVDGMAGNYTIDVSDNASTWTTISTITGNAATTTTTDVSGTGRYVRINMTQRHFSWSSYQIYELQIFNTTTTNTAPVVSLTAPASNATFIAGSNITLSATASDADGTISKVEFFNGATKLGEVTSSPYNYTWTNVAAGSYSITAKATDNGNASTTSSAASILVTAISASGGGWELTGNSGTTPGTNFIGTTDAKKLVFKTNNTSRLTILSNGAVAIGADTITNSEAKLAVNGAIYTNKLKVTQSSWADYVFDKGYKLRSLSEVEAYIRQHNHLPDVPATAEVQQQGTDVAEIQATLLRKIEELTLYVIKQDKQLNSQQQEIRQLKKQLSKSRR